MRIALSIWMGLCGALLAGATHAQTDDTASAAVTGYWAYGNPPCKAPSVRCFVQYGAGGTSNTVAPTAAGTSGTQANGVQGVTGGVPVATSAAAPTYSVPTGGNYAVTTSDGTAIPASSSRLRLSYQLQGAGVACASFVTTAVTITGTGAATQCGGAGAFLLQTGSSVNLPSTSVPVMPSTALTVIGSANTLNLVWDAQ